MAYFAVNYAQPEVWIETVDDDEVCLISRIDPRDAADFEAKKHVGGLIAAALNAAYPRGFPPLGSTPTTRN